MAKSDKRVLVKLRSTAGTGFTYVTTKNKQNQRERLELRKYDPMGTVTTHESIGFRRGSVTCAACRSDARSGRLDQRCPRSSSSR